MSKKGRNTENSLTDLSGLMGRLKGSSVDAILEDYDKDPTNMKNQKLFQTFKNFFGSSLHLLKIDERVDKADKLLFQLAYEHAEDSPITRQAEEIIKNKNADWVWMKQLNRKKGSGENPNYKTLTEYTESIKGLKLLDSGRMLSWTGSFSRSRLDGVRGSLRLWNLNDYSSVELDGEISVRSKGEPGNWSRFDHIMGVRFISDAKVLTWSPDYMRLWDLSTGKSNIYFSRLPNQEYGLPQDDDNLHITRQDTIIYQWSDSFIVWHLQDGSVNKIDFSEQGGILKPTHGRFGSWVVLNEKKIVFINRGTSDSANKPYLDEIPNFNKVSMTEGVFVSGQRLYDICGILKIDNNRLFVFSSDNSIDLLDYTHNTLKRIAANMSNQVNIEFLVSEKAIIWDYDQKANGWLFILLDLTDGDLTRTLKFDQGATIDGKSKLNFVGDNDGKYIFHIKGLNRIIQVDFDGDMVSLYHLKHSSPVGDILFESPNAVVSWSQDSTIQRIDLANERAAVFNGHTKDVNGVIHHKAKKYISFSEDNTIRFWDLEIGKQEREFEFINSEMESPFSILDFLSIDEHRLISWTKENITCWNLSEGANTVFKLAHTNKVIQLNNDELIAVHDQTSVTILNIVSGKQNKLEGHKAAITDVLMINNNKGLFSWSQDGTIKLWDLTAHECVMTYVFEGVEKVHKISDNKYMCISSNKKYRVLELQNYSS